MAYSSLKLITSAYYLSGIVSRQFETVEGQQATDGLQFLNEVISDSTVDKSIIPYFTRFEFDAISGVQEYFIADLIEIDTLVFFIDSVRYSMEKQGRRSFFGSGRAENIQSLPYDWHLERGFGGATLFMYFTPDLNYPMQLWGKFRLSTVTLTQDLSLTLDQFYINFLKYELADRLCTENNYPVPPPTQKQLLKYQLGISKRSAILDLTEDRMSTLSGNTSINYADVNIGHGWRPN